MFQESADQRRRQRNVSMKIALEEFKELNRIRENVRRNTDALELCSSCQRISECERFVWDHGASVWLCKECRKKKQEPLPLLLPTPSIAGNLRTHLNWSGLEWWKVISRYLRGLGNLICRFRPMGACFAFIRTNRAFRRNVQKYAYTRGAGGEDRYH